MTIKYGVRHYKEVGAFLAFKDKLFMGFLINRQWLGRNGIVLKTYDTMNKAVCTSKEEAVEVIQQHIELNKLIESEHLGEYSEEYIDEGDL